VDVVEVGEVKRQKDCVGLGEAGVDTLGGAVFVGARGEDDQMVWLGLGNDEGCLVAQAGGAACYDDCRLVRHGDGCLVEATGFL